MEAFIHYLIKSSLLLGVLILFYRLIFKHETYFLLNRLLLLASIISSVLILPFLPTLYAIPIKNISPVNILQEIVLSPVIINSRESSTANWLFISLNIYIAIAALLFTRFLFQITQILRLYIKNKPVKATSYYLIFVNYPPFSFFNLIFINPQNNLNEIDIIIAHEKVHVKQCHTLDILLVEMICILHWFNPLVWWYRSSIREVHEYIADQFVLNSGYEKKGYQSLLLSVATGIKLLRPENNFNSFIKKRLIMMTKSKSKGISLAKYLLTIPMFIILCLFPSLQTESVFAVAKNEGSPNKEMTIFPSFLPANKSLSTVIQQQKQKKQQTKSQIFTVVETQPEFIGGETALADFIKTNIRYPQLAKEKGITGTVYVTFVIGTKGEVSNVKVLRSAHTLLDIEAVRVVKLMTEKWKPGVQKGKAVKVQMNLPVKFLLDGKADKH